MDATRELVALGCRILGAQGQGDLVWGHLSARDAEGRGVWMKSAGWGFEEVTPDRVVLVSWTGDVLIGQGRRHAEYPIHTRIMAARPDVGAVVHTHSPAAVALAATGHPVRPMSHEGVLFAFPDAPRFDRTGDLVLTDDLGDALAARLGDHRAVLMPRHGIATAAADVPQAVMTAVLLDRACTVQLTAMAAAGPDELSWSDPEEARAKREHCYPPALMEQAWQHLVRLLPPT